MGILKEARFEKSLHETEKILYAIVPSLLSSPHIWLGVFLFFYGILLGSFISGAGIFFLILSILMIQWGYVKIKRTTYYITNVRVVMELPFFNYHVMDITYDKITDVQARQSFLERILDYGHVIINTAGTPLSELKIMGVRNYAELGEAINGCRAKKSTTTEESPLAILKKRFARGEINEDEFLKKKRLLAE
ncbi:MAG: PH domain-containing protein [archaeon]